jgi:hypothetical protein
MRKSSLVISLAHQKLPHGKVACLADVRAISQSKFLGPSTQSKFLGPSAQSKFLGPSALWVKGTMGLFFLSFCQQHCI